MPIVGSFAGASARAYGLGASSLINYSFDSIQTITVGAGGQASVEFTSIPQTYTHLQIRGIAKNNSTSTTGDANALQLNGDTAANYSTHYLQSDGTNATSGAVANSTFMYAGFCARSNASYTSMFGVSLIDILDYANTNKFKTVRSFAGLETNSIGYCSVHSGNWRNTNAITSVKLFVSGNNYVQYTSFALYGVKA